jgi:hypothetical protein
MVNRIEQSARQAWGVLGKAGEINVLRLAEYLGERSVIAYQALGWLAREGKIRYHQKGNQVYVSLTDEEQTRFDGLASDRKEEL